MTPSPAPGRPGARPGRRSVLAALGGGLALPFLPRPAAAQNAMNGVVLGRDGWLFAQGDAMGVVDPQRVRRTAGVLKEAISILRGARIETAMALAPSRARLFRDMLPEGVRIAPNTDQRLAQARGEFAALNVLAPDLYAPFRQARESAPATPLFFKADTHWMSFGAELAATETARAIRTQFRLPAPPGPGARLDPPSLSSHVSDLAAQLPVAERSKYPSQTFPARPEITEGASLLDEEKPDVAVVGNSFMHPRYGFARALSFLMERPVALHWQIHQTGPYRTLLNYLGGETFRQNRPVLLVWNLHEMDMEMTPDRSDVWRNNAMPAADFIAELKRVVGT